MSTVTPLKPIDDAHAALAVAEIFGPTWQGEGPSLGRLCSFIRLGGCNLHCSWCDTPYTWDWTGMNGRKYDPRAEVHAMMVMTAAPDLVRRSGSGRFDPMFVISGGEPMLQSESIGALIRYTNGISGGHPRWEIETNGTIIPTFPSDYITQYNVSPKLPDSGNNPEVALVHDSLRWYQRTGRAVFKFVVSHVSDLDMVVRLQAEVGIPAEQIWIMPEGTNLDIIWRGQFIADTVLELGYNMTTRLHVLLWGNKRGV